MLYYDILYYMILYYTILYYTILYYTTLYYTILLYTILKAVDEFWGLQPDDLVDLERLIELIETPRSSDDERSKLDPAAWGLPFLSEPGGSAARLRGPANDQDQNSIVIDHDGGSKSDTEDPNNEKSDSEDDVCDAPNFDVGEYVICRPADGSDAQFWIGQVIADPKNVAGSRSRDVSLHWLDQTERFTKDRRPHFRLSYTLSNIVKHRGKKGAQKR